VLSSFTKLGKHLETFYDLMAALDKLGHIEDLPMEGTGSIGLPSRVEGMAVSVEGVRYGQPGFSQLLDGLSWRIEPGERVGLIPDRSRHGVAALLDMLLKLREPAAGFLEADGVDLRDIRLADLRGQALLLREQDIFAGTIEDNVRFGRNDCSPLEVREALDRVGLLREIANLPGGVKTPLLPNGYPLSPEQAARLILARALVARTRLLIVDELLDRVDDRSQRELIVKQLLASNQPRSVIIVSTSPAVLSSCDRVYRLENGRLHELPVAVLLNGQMPR
jgi:ABC-type transport system involved in cytochrome bd biosynthesis fused ATPase/permease subunit